MKQQQQQQEQKQKKQQQQQQHQQQHQQLQQQQQQQQLTYFSVFKNGSVNRRDIKHQKTNATQKLCKECATSMQQKHHATRP